MKLNKKQLNKYLDFLYNQKHLIGLTDYDIILNTEIKILGNNLAEVKAEHLEKKLTITLGEGFNKKTEETQKNILLHELVHSRFALMRQQQDEGNNDYFEECFINDLVRGFERFGELKWND